MLAGGRAGYASSSATRRRKAFPSLARARAAVERPRPARHCATEPHARIARRRRRTSRRNSVIATTPRLYARAQVGLEKQRNTCRSRRADGLTSQFGLIAAILKRRVRHCTGTAFPKPAAGRAHAAVAPRASRRDRFRHDAARRYRIRPIGRDHRACRHGRDPAISSAPSRPGAKAQRPQAGNRSKSAAPTRREPKRHGSGTGGLACER